MRVHPRPVVAVEMHMMVAAELHGRNVKQRTADGKAAAPE
jgi:hypothetical protein